MEETGLFSLSLSLALSLPLSLSLVPWSVPHVLLLVAICGKKEKTVYFS